MVVVLFRRRRKHRRVRFGSLALLVLLIVGLWGGSRPVGTLDGGGTQAEAHRGANREAPENTLPAFARAAENGAWGVETDVFLTKDGIAVLSHDDTIDRCSDGEGRIADMTLAELNEYDFGAWFSQAYTDTPIPTVEAFLETVAGLEQINIELKDNEGGIAAVVTGQVQARGLLEKTVFSSFNLEALVAVTEACPEAQTAFIYQGNSPYALEILKDAGAFCAKYKLSGLHPVYACVCRKLLKNAHAAGIAVRPWTVNESFYAAGLIRLGADAIITDDTPMVEQVREEQPVSGIFSAALLNIAGHVYPLYEKVKDILD